MKGRSVVDIGMEILRAEGALPVETPTLVVHSPEVEGESDDEDDETELDTMKALANQLTVLADRLAVRETLDSLALQVSKLTQLVVQLQIMVTQPKIKVPIRDEAGRITEVREMIAPTEPPNGD